MGVISQRSVAALALSLASCSPAAPAGPVLGPEPVVVTAPAPAPTQEEPPASEPVASRKSPPLTVAVAPPQLPLAASPELSAQAARHHPALVDQPPKPARIAPGAYRCKVSQEYKLRACTVEKDEDGRTLLIVHEGNLLGMKGVLWDDAGAVQFEGWLTEPRPFGCFSCQPRCSIDPSSCGCVELTEEASRECLAQPLRMRITGGPASWRGNLEYRVYYNRYENRERVGYEPRLERFEFSMVR